MDIDNLIERLMNLTYRAYRDKDDITYFHIISNSHKEKVCDEIKSWYKAQKLSDEIIEYKRKIAELEAKVYAYEKIIANSNFAPIIRELSIREISEEK